MSVGENIKYYRRMRGLTQSDLAEMLGLCKQTISSWEVNRTEPNMENVNAMCQIFHCSASNIADIPEAPTYSDDIMELILLYTKITDEQKASVLSMLRSFVN